MPYHHILFIIDNEENQNQAFDQVLTLCQRQQARLSIIKIIEKLAKYYHPLTAYLSSQELKDYVQKKSLAQ